MSLFYEEATCKSSTIEGLLCALDPEKRKKGMLSDRPPTIACHIYGTSVPLGMTVAQRYDVPWD
jgi:hypothetical protein